MTRLAGAILLVPAAGLAQPSGGPPAADAAAVRDCRERRTAMIHDAQSRASVDERMAILRALPVCETAQPQPPPPTEAPPVAHRASWIAAADLGGGVVPDSSLATKPLIDLTVDASVGKFIDSRLAITGRVSAHLLVGRSDADENLGNTGGSLVWIGPQLLRLLGDSAWLGAGGGLAVAGGHVAPVLSLRVGTRFTTGVVAPTIAIEGTAVIPELSGTDMRALAILSVVVGVQIDPGR